MSSKPGAGQIHRSWILTVAAGLVVASIGIVAFVIFNLGDQLESSLCKTTVQRELSSPDGALTLVVFNRDCGATTDFNTQVSLMPRDTAFSSDTYPSFFGVNGQQKLAIYWTGDRRLEIVLQRGETTFKQLSSINGVVVQYSVRPARAECIVGLSIDWSSIKGDRNEVRNSLSDWPNGNQRIKLLACGAVDPDGSHMYLQFSDDCGKKQEMAAALIAYWQSQGMKLPKFTRVEEPIAPSTKTIDCKGPHWSDPAQ